MEAVFALALAAGVYLILRPLFGFLERGAASPHLFPWRLATGIAAAVFAITAVYVVGALSLCLLCSLTAQYILSLLVAGLLLAFCVIFLLLILQQQADDGRYKPAITCKCNCANTTPSISPSPI